MIDVTAMQFLLVQNRHQTHGWTLIGSGANGLGILEWYVVEKIALEVVQLSKPNPSTSCFLNSTEELDLLISHTLS